MSDFDSPPSEFGFEGASDSAARKPRTLPHNLDAERSVLGGILLDNMAMNEVVELVKEDDFYRPAHTKIFQAQMELGEKGEPIDEITLVNQLRAQGDLDAVGGATYIASLVERIPTAANIVFWSKMVREKAISRKLILAATEIATEGYEDGGDVDGLLDRAEQIVFQISDQREKKGLTSVKETVKEALKRLEKLYEKKEAVTGVPTGYDELDKMLAGLQPSDLLILAARPSVGKTALALNIVCNAAVRHKRGVAVFSLEMSKEQLVTRMLCSEGRIDGSRMRGGMLAESDWPRLARAAGSISETSVMIDDSGALNILDLRSKCRRMAAEGKLDLIVIDYLQLMRGVRPMNSREQEISEISRGLKAIAKELHVPVLALSQLNRGVDARADKRPMMSDLRESGAIEQDADVICFIYRDEVYNPETADKGVAEIIIAKQRNGPIGTVKLKFFHEYTRYENLAVQKE